MVNVNNMSMATKCPNRVSAIYQFLLGTKTCNDYYETDKLPNPRPTQPKKNRFKVVFGPLFPTANIFSLVGIGFT